MTHLQFGKFVSVAGLTLGVILGTGCGDSQIKTYKVAREDNTPTAPPMMAQAEQHDEHDGHSHGPAVPKVHFDTPKGWKEIPPGEMRAAAFNVMGNDGQTAEVAIIPLPGKNNKELESVNMWREQLALTPLTSQQMNEQAQPVQVGDTQGRLYEMASATPKEGSKAKTRMLGVTANREGVAWFVKMLGDDQFVEAQKPVFVQFLKTVSFEVTPQVAAADEQPISTNTKNVPPGSEAPKWKAPANWQEKAPGPMITAAYSISGQAGAAEVTISKFPGDVGGKAANVNRWRGQLGLAPASEADMGSSVQMVEIDGKKNAYMVDLKGTNARTGRPARMIALGVPRGGETWFYKLLGDDAVVEKEKDAFLQFVRGAY